jgi:hypothetical protein
MPKKAQVEPQPADSPTTRKRAEIQPEIGLKIEAAKKQIGTLKQLNKLLPLLDKLTDDGQDQVIAYITTQRENKSE